jgi:hypothetical protein
MIKFQIGLDTTSFKALRALAEHEYRDPRAQAALIIRQELERRGLLAAQPPALPLAAGAVQQHPGGEAC